MIKTVIIEDEPKVKESLVYLLEKYCSDLQICGVAGTFEEAYSLVNTHKPQLIFADIQLNSPEGTGIDLVNTLCIDNLLVIFISGWKDYAVEAFRMNAVDYLLKPVNIQQLMQAVEKVRRSIEWNTSVVKSDRAPGTLHIPTHNGFMIIQQDDIVRCEAEGPYTHFFIKDKSRKITSSINLGHTEQKLRKDIFFRVHKSHIINRQHILEYQRGEGGIAKMSDLFEAPVSRSMKEDFLKWLDGSQ